MISSMNFRGFKRHLGFFVPAGLKAVVFFGLLIAGTETTRAFETLEIDPGGPFKVVEVIDADTLVLADGREVRFVGIQAPKLPLGRKGFKKWPLADEAKAFVQDLVLGKEVHLAYGGRRIDRHGRVLAHLFLAGRGSDLQEETWVQAQILAAGLARVYSFPDNRAALPRLLALEREARAANKGIWSNPYYRIREALDLERNGDQDHYSFQLVEGRVLSAAEIKGRSYLNFGSDWKRDFTISLSPRVTKLFKKEGLDPKSYEGKALRIRGWIKSFNGPMIEATHPEQIEVLQE